MEGLTYPNLHNFYFIRFDYSNYTRPFPANIYLFKVNNRVLNILKKVSNMLKVINKNNWLWTSKCYLGWHLTYMAITLHSTCPASSILISLKNDILKKNPDFSNLESVLDSTNIHALKLKHLSFHAKFQVATPHPRIWDKVYRVLSLNFWTLNVLSFLITFE